MGEAIKIEHGRAGVSETMLAAFHDAMRNVAGTFEVREAAALVLSGELMRRWTADELEQMATELEDEVVIDGERYRRHSEGTARYHTLCGTVAVRRGLYRLVGVHNGPTVVPLELRAGIWENATPALAFSVTQGFATQPPRHYEAEMAAAYRQVPSRSTLERIGKRIGGAINETIDEAEPWLRVAEPMLDGVHSISVGLDRTTVPMAEPIANAPIPEPRIRRRPRPVSVAYRMAYVGTVTLHDDHGRALVTKRFGATPHEGPDELLDRIAGELIHQRARYDVAISVIQDGAPELWNLVAAMCEGTRCRSRTR